MSGVVADGLTTQPLLTVTVEKGDANDCFARFVRADGTRIAAAGAAAIGVGRSHSTTNGELVPVAVAGIVPVEAGAAIALANGEVAVKSDATGRAIAQGGSGAILGRALAAASAAGDKVPVLLTP